MKIVGRYCWFCLAAIFFFAIYSYVLDQAYYQIDYGTTTSYRYSIPDYAVRTLIASLPFSIAIPTAYNLIVNEVIMSSRYRTPFRFLLATAIGLALGYGMHRRGISFYVGQFRAQKNMFLYPLIGISLEICRSIKLYRTNRVIPKIVLYVSFSLLSQQTICAQDTCLRKTNFLTDSMGTRADKFRIQLRVDVREDSVVFRSAGRSASEFLAFKIIKRNGCKWNADCSEGTTSYHLMLNDEGGPQYATLNIVYGRSSRYIELLYEGKEERIFTIKSDEGH